MPCPQPSQRVRDIAVLHRSTGLYGSESTGALGRTHMSNNTLDHADKIGNTTNPQDKASALAAVALADLASNLDAGHSDALTAYLRFLGRFHRYSALNTLLIMIQNPEATHVAGYGRWQDLKRQVRKGEKGIAILAPCTFKKRDDQMDDRRDDRKADVDDDQTRQIVKFRTAYVFDVSQTDGEALPSFPEISGNPGYQLAALKSLVGELGIGLGYMESLGGARGVSTGGRILLLHGLKPAEEFSTMVHELSHELLHRDSRRSETTVGIRELEAEAVAYVVSSAIGLDNNDASASYIQLYRGDSRQLAASLQHIQRVSCEILDYLL